MILLLFQNEFIIMYLCPCDIITISKRVHLMYYVPVILLLFQNEFIIMYLCPCDIITISKRVHYNVSMSL